MEDFLPQLPFIILPLVVGILFWIYLKADKKHPEEENKTPELSFKCGGVIGWTQYKGPFVRVSVYSDFLIIAHRKIILFKFNEFTLKEGLFLFTKSITFKHEKSDYPEKIELFIPDIKSFLDLMNSKGMKII